MKSIKEELIELINNVDEQKLESINSYRIKELSRLSRSPYNAYRYNQIGNMLIDMLDLCQKRKTPTIFIVKANYCDFECCARTIVGFDSYKAANRWIDDNKDHYRGVDLWIKEMEYVVK